MPERYAGVSRRRRLLRLTRGRKKYPRGRNDSSVRITLRAILQHCRAWLQSAGTKLGATQIHVDAAFAPGLQDCSLQVGDHGRPFFRAVMRAVDTPAIHAVEQ